MSAKLVWALLLLAGVAASAETLGSIVRIEEFPSLAQVEFKVDLMWVQRCLGSIITNYHILSAASCFSGADAIPEYRRIRVGTSYRGRGGEVAVIARVYTHPYFGLLGHDSDITVVSLTSSFTFGPTVQQTSILGQGIELPFGMNTQMVGWGTTAEGGDVSSDDLYQLGLYVNYSDRCLEQYIYEQEVTENMLCVGLSFASGRDFDLNDRGAPLFYQSTLVGFLVFGKSANDEYPIGSTNVGSYTQWVIDTATSQ